MLDNRNRIKNFFYLTNFKLNINYFIFCIYLIFKFKKKIKFY